MIGCLRTRVRKQPIIVLYFKFETVLKFYNLGAWKATKMGKRLADGYQFLEVRCHTFYKEKEAPPGKLRNPLP